MNDQLPSSNATQSLEGNVRTMPAYYLPKGTASAGMSTKTILLIVGGVIIILIIVVFALIFMQSGQQSQQIATTIEPTVTQTPAIVTEPEEVEVVEEEPVEEDVQEDEVQETGVVLPDLSNANLIPGSDTDQDGLSDAEELLFSTSSAAPDTDQDSFLDGSEIRNLYDPASPSALLEVSPQIKIARNTVKSYQLLVPQSFSVQTIDVNGNEFRVVAPSNGGTFTITMYTNDDRSTPVQWYQQMSGSSDLSIFDQFSNEAGWNGIQSQDGRIVISTYGTSSTIGGNAFIFVMEYAPGPDNTLNYSAVWEMMLQSLAVLDQSAVEQQSTSTQPTTTTPTNPTTDTTTQPAPTGPTQDPNTPAPTIPTEDPNGPVPTIPTT